MAVKRGRKKSENLTEKYEYTGEGELIVDKPSAPLKKVNESQVVVKSNKELYESYIKELKNYSLLINGEVMYDSSIDRSGNIPVSFENDYFVLYGKKYSYNGLRIQKIK